MRFGLIRLFLLLTVVLLSSCSSQERASVEAKQAAAPSNTGDACKYSGAKLGKNSALGGVLAFPDTHWSRQTLAAYPKDPNSDALICTVDTERPCGHNLWPHPGFGSSPENGIPYYVVDNSQTMVPITIKDYAAESDVTGGIGIAPLPDDGTIIESYRKPDGDHHVILINKDSCWLYEFNRASYDPASKRWSAASQTIWDLSNDTMRPIGWTSADAAGLPIFPTLVKYEEAHSGIINHVIRGEFTNSRAAFVPPATHYTTSGMGSHFPPMGMRWRLKPTFDTTLGGRATKEVHAILEAMKTYGLINQDNSGGGFFVDGVPDPRWDDETLHNQLTSIHISDFEFVTNNKNGAPTTTYGPEGDVRDLPTGKSPQILSFKVEPESIDAGQSVTLTYSTKGASYIFISPEIGPVRDQSGSVTVHPRAATTYTIAATNGFGREVQSKRVKVKGSAFGWDSPREHLVAYWDFTNADDLSCAAKCAPGMKPVSARDSSGNGHVLNFNGAVTYETSVRGLHNPISVIRFSGGSASISPALPKLESFTIIAVLKPTTRGILITGNDAESGYLVGGKQLLVDSYRRTDGGKNIINADAFHQTSVTYDKSQIRFRLDGSSDGDVRSNAVKQTVGFFLVGDTQSGGYTGFRGDLAALAVYEGAMSASDLAKLESFINSKY